MAEVRVFQLTFSMEQTPAQLARSYERALLEVNQSNFANVLSA